MQLAATVLTLRHPTCDPNHHCIGPPMMPKETAKVFAISPTQVMVHHKKGPFNKLPRKITKRVVSGSIDSEAE